MNFCILYQVNNLFLHQSYLKAHSIEKYRKCPALATTTCVQVLSYGEVAKQWLQATVLGS